MRRPAVIVLVLALPVLFGGVARAKLPPFSFEATPDHVHVGQPITLTMQCFDEIAHTEPWPSCFGQGGGRMAWVHPLDVEGDLDRSDWIAVEGRATASGATVGTIVLSEPGPYVVRPLWRGWGGPLDDPHHIGRGFPNPVRLEVIEPGASVGTWVFLLSVAGVLVAGLGLRLVRQRRRNVPDYVVAPVLADESAWRQFGADTRTHRTHRHEPHRVA